MAEGSHKVCKRSSSSDTFLSGEPTRPVGRPNVDRVYPTGLGLRPKACPRPHTATGFSTRDALPVQGPVDRCLTIVRAMNIDIADDDGGNTAGPVDHIEASGGALNQITSNHEVDRQEPRPGQSASRNSTIRVGCDALRAQMRDALPHVRCSLQSHPGKALHQTGR